jgi:hypothetical protein
MFLLMIKPDLEFIKLYDPEPTDHRFCLFLAGKHLNTGALEAGALSNNVRIDEIVLCSE